MKRKIVKTAALALCLMCIGGQVYAAPVEQETETVTSEVLAQEFVAESEPGTVPGETVQETETTETSEAESEEEVVETETASEKSEEPESESATEAETKKQDDLKEDMIDILTPDNGPDEEGYVTMAMRTANDVVLPVKITMKKNDEETTLSVAYQGQQIRIKPGTYRLTSVVDGNGKKLDDGARLTIPEENGNVYLDFKKPDGMDDNMFLQFLRSNFLFIPIAGLIYLLYQYLMKRR